MKICKIFSVFSVIWNFWKSLSLVHKNALKPKSFSPTLEGSKWGQSYINVLLALCLKRHEVSEKIGLGSLAHFMVDMKQGKLKCKKNFKIHVHLTKLLTI